MLLAHEEQRRGLQAAHEARVAGLEQEAAEQRRRLAECEGAAEARADVARLQLANDELVRSHALACEAIEERAAAVATLRTMLDRAMRCDERKQAQVEALQRERDELNARVSALMAQLKAANAAPEATMAVAVAVAQPRDDLEARARKLQRRLDAANERYAALLYEHRKGRGEGVRVGGSPLRCHSFVLFESQGSRNDGARRKRLSASVEKEARLVKSAYLRKVVLQYFSLERESERTTMVPILLELVGCTVDQIAVVNRHLQRNQSLIARTAGFFGF
jgi:DNA repair exonuclease SbcCD ATPase subunit